MAAGRRARRSGAGCPGASARRPGLRPRRPPRACGTARAVHDRLLAAVLRDEADEERQVLVFGHGPLADTALLRPELLEPRVLLVAEEQLREQRVLAVEQLEADGLVHGHDLREAEH